MVLVDEPTEQEHHRSDKYYTQRPYGKQIYAVNRIKRRAKHHRKNQRKNSGQAVLKEI